LENINLRLGKRTLPLGSMSLTLCLIYQHPACQENVFCGIIVYLHGSLLYLIEALELPDEHLQHCHDIFGKNVVLTKMQSDDLSHLMIE
jgi:hypothetical protein